MRESRSPYQRLIWLVMVVTCVGVNYLHANFPMDDGIHWASESNDGLLVGLKHLPNSAIIDAEQVGFQFLVKNTTEETKTLACLPVRRLLFDVRADNLLFERVQVFGPEPVELTLAPGELVEPEQFRLVLSTKQLLPGTYTIPTLIGLSKVEQNKSGAMRMTNLGAVRKVGFTIAGEEPKVASLSDLELDTDGVHWGEPLMGIALGAKLVQVDADGTLQEKSQRFHLDESLTLQLILLNLRDSPVALEVEPARRGDPWEMAVFNEESKRQILKQMNRGMQVQRPSGMVTLAAGEHVVITGVAMKTFLPGDDSSSMQAAEEGLATFEHASVDLVSLEDRRLQNQIPVLEAELGNYFATATVHVRLQKSDFAAALTSGLVPFRVVEDLLRQKTASD